QRYLPKSPRFDIIRYDPCIRHSFQLGRRFIPSPYLDRVFPIDKKISLRRKGYAVSGMADLVEKERLPQTTLVGFFGREREMKIGIFKKDLVRFLQYADTFAGGGKRIDQPGLFQVVEITDQRVAMDIGLFCQFGDIRFKRDVGGQYIKELVYFPC